MLDYGKCYIMDDEWPQRGRGHGPEAVFINFGNLSLTFERVKIDISDLMYRVIMTSTIQRMINYPRRGLDQGYMTAILGRPPNFRTDDALQIWYTKWPWQLLSNGWWLNCQKELGHMTSFCNFCPITIIGMGNYNHFKLGTHVDHEKF